MRKRSSQQTEGLSRLKLALALSTVLSLTGCDAITSFNLSMAHQKLREECFAQFSNRCNNKTAKFNIKVIKASSLASPQTKVSIMENFGQPGWELWEEVEKETKRKAIAANRAVRPNWFSRWFLGEAQPFNGKQVLELNPEDMVFLQQRTLEAFMSEARATGLRRKEPEAPTAAARQSPESVNPSLSTALERLVAEETSANGGNEFSEARQMIQVDLNEDGTKDAVILFTIEGQEGGNSSYQILAALYQQANGWVVGDRVTTKGATELELLGDHLFGLTELTHAEDDPTCCPSLESQEKYRWIGTRFVLLQE